MQSDRLVGAEHTAAKAALYEQFAVVGKALGNSVRLLLLDLLAQGERSVDDLVRELGMKLSNTSAQLQVLRHAGLVETRREGTSIYYRLAGDDVATLVDGVRTVASTRLAAATDAAAAYLGDRSTMQQITAAELRRRIKAGDVEVIDVRPAIEYEAGHIPTARSIPIEQLERRLDELSADTQIVAYCRGPWCVYAPDAARLLERRGYDVSVFTDGYPGWRRNTVTRRSAPRPRHARQTAQAVDET
jgi:rhodanese-related sulfurtransferase/predicted transcriptional regulator